MQHPAIAIPWHTGHGRPILPWASGVMGYVFNDCTVAKSFTRFKCAPLQENVQKWQIFYAILRHLVNLRFRNEYEALRVGTMLALSVA